MDFAPGRDAFIERKLNGSAAATGRRMRGERIRRAGRGEEHQDNTPPPVADDQLGRAFLRAVRRRVRRFMRWLPPPVCGPAFGSCSGGASGGDAWASASDTVNTS